jgi:Domain of unknown function (DUF4167)
VNNNFIRSNQNKNNNNRNRNRNNNRRNTGSGGGGGGPSNKVFDSNGPDIKLRGTTQTIAEKYMQLGRDSQSSGDSVAAENYYQHAEHYYRLWAASQPIGHSLQMSRKLGEEEFEDESDEQSSGDDEGEVGSGNGDSAPVEGQAQLEGSVSDPNVAPGDGQQQQRPFRNNNYRDNNNRNPRPRWQNNRNNRNYDSGPQTSEPTGAVVAADTQVEDRIGVPAPTVAEAHDQWEAPSFLQRPTTAPAETVEAIVSEDAPSPRKYRPRKPKAEADVPLDDGSNSVE